MKYLNVEGVQQISDDLFELFLVRSGIEYKVGNCMALYGPDEKTSRPYSLASGVNDTFLSYIIKKIPDGYVSNYLCTLKQGDSVKVSNPYGWFTPGSLEKSIFVSTGSGIAPFMSCIRSRLSPPEKFYVGCRHENELGLIPKFISSLNINIEICSSRSMNSNGYQCRVTESLAADLEMERYTSNNHFYLCGLDAMIVDTTELLMKYNIPRENIHHEVFFMKSEE